MPDALSPALDASTFRPAPTCTPGELIVTPAGLQRVASVAWARAA